MTKEEIVKACDCKEQELLDKHFGNLVKEAAHERPETVGEYTLDLPLKIEQEYRAFLEGIWAEFAPGQPLVLEEQKLRKLITDDDREGIAEAYKDAIDITLWERLTKSNHEDVTYYKGLLQAYTKDLLTVMKLDFLEEVIGQPINNKMF